MLVRSYHFSIQCLTSCSSDTILRLNLDFSALDNYLFYLNIRVYVQFVWREGHGVHMDLRDAQRRRLDRLIPPTDLLLPLC